MKYWWVNQKKTHKQEIPGGFLWSPKTRIDGARNQYYLNMTSMEVGDVVFCYYNGEIKAVAVVAEQAQTAKKPDFGRAGDNWSSEGWYVKAEYRLLDNPIKPKEYIDLLLPLMPEKYAPLKANGDGKEFYLTEVPLPLAKTLGRLIGSELDIKISQIINTRELISEATVAVALEPPLAADPSRLPVGAADTLTVTGDPDFRATLKPIHQLSRSLPTHSLDEFRRKTAGLLTKTEAERLTVVRVGQEIFRNGLLAYWDGACAITGLSVPELLRASHAKPWASCDTDDERLDTHNGLLLAGHLDLAFDQGYISVAPDGAVEVSARLDAPARTILSLDSPRRISRIDPAHRPYLAWHREHVFQ